jgi:hypothetical protein
MDGLLAYRFASRARGEHVMIQHTSTQDAEVLEDRTRAGKETTHILGRSQDEIRRLIDQAVILLSTTGRQGVEI